MNINLMIGLIISSISMGFWYIYLKPNLDQFGDNSILLILGCIAMLISGLIMILKNLIVEEEIKND